MPALRVGGITDLYWSILAVKTEKSFCLPAKKICLMDKQCFRELGQMSD